MKLGGRPTLTPGPCCRSFESTSTNVFVPKPKKEHRKIEARRTIEVHCIQGHVDCCREHSHMGYNLGVRESYSHGTHGSKRMTYAHGHISRLAL